MSLATMLARYKTGTYTRTRTTAGAYVTGRFVAGTTTTDSLDLCIQPLGGRDLKILPEGRRADDTRVVYSLTELRTTSPAGAADKLTIDGEVWEVFHVDPWLPLRPSVNYYRALVGRTTPSGGP